MEDDRAIRADCGPLQDVVRSSLESPFHATIRNACGNSEIKGVARLARIVDNLHGHCRQPRRLRDVGDDACALPTGDGCGDAVN